MTAFGRVALDAEEVPAPSNGGDSRLAWHPPPARVTGARLLGFVRGRCADGREKGLVLVRSIWRADVALLPWRPEHEIPFRRTVPASELARYLWTEPGAEPIFARAAREAGLTLSS